MLRAFLKNFKAFLKNEKNTLNSKASGLANEKWSFEGIQGSYQECIPECTSIKINWGYLWEDKVSELIKNKSNKEATNSNSMIDI